MYHILYIFFLNVKSIFKHQFNNFLDLKLFNEYQHKLIRQ